MFRTARFCLKAFAVWMLLTTFGHTALGIPDLVNTVTNPLSSRHAGLQALAADPSNGFFDYNLLDLFFLGMLMLSALLVFSALVGGWVAMKLDNAAVRQFSRLNAGFWATALVAELLFYPVDNMVVILLGAVLFSALALWRAEAATA
ncbi:MAG TPA: hypothetical protein VD713_06920 [Sphingomonadales bacterium]|nr:hypothetical protein [Sphingomonadales bacterium]